MTEVIHYPVMFVFRDAISGDGFLAGVTLSGRALMIKEGEEWWVYGVRPGAIAEHGTTPQETFLRFKDRYRTVLFDMAEEFKDFEAFRREVERFYYEPDEEEERRWNDAVEGLRSGNVTPAPPFSELPKEPPQNRPAQVTVERLDTSDRRFTPTDNVVDRYVMAAA